MLGEDFLVSDLWDDPAWDQRPWTDAECYLLSIWQNVLGLPRVGLNQDFFSLMEGSDQITDLFDSVAAVFGVSLEKEDLRANDTVEKLALFLEKSCRGMIPDHPLCLKKGGRRLPIFCVCGLYLYRELSWFLDDEVPVYGISIPLEKTMIRVGRGGEATWPGIRELASAYLERLLIVQPRGPYRLAGAAYGGLIAYEMARQLEKLGEHVQLVVLFESQLPNSDQKRALPWVKHQAGTLLKDKGKHAWKRLKEFFVQRNRHLFPPDDLDPRHLADFREQVYREAAIEYHREPARTRIQLFRSDDENIPAFLDRDISLGWRHLAVGPFEIHTVRGNHVGILGRPGVGEIAKHLQDCLNLLDCKKSETMI